MESELTPDADADAAPATEPAERERAIRASLLGVALGVALAALGRRPVSGR